MAGALEHYMATSEQLETRLWLAADGEHAAGMLLQRLPESGESDAEHEVKNVVARVQGD